MLDVPKTAPFDCAPQKPAGPMVSCHRCKRLVPQSDAIDMRRLFNKPMTEPWRCRPCFRTPQPVDGQAA